MATVGKLYLATPHSSQNIGQTARLELKGTVNLIIYGSEDFSLTQADLTPVSEAITEDFYYPLDTLPKYVAFVGTADRINVGGYDLVEQGDLV